MTLAVEEQSDPQPKVHFDERKPIPADELLLLESHFIKVQLIKNFSLIFP